METTRNERLKKAFEEVRRRYGIRSVTQLAKELKCNQKTMNNYISGDTEPMPKVITAFCERFPEYNVAWLMDGEGSKYVDGTEHPQSVVTRADETNPINKAMDKIIDMYNDRLAYIRRKLQSAVECPDPEDVKRRLSELLEDM